MPKIHKLRWDKRNAGTVGSGGQQEFFILCKPEMCEPAVDWINMGHSYHKKTRKWKEVDCTDCLELGKGRHVSKKEKASLFAKGRTIHKIFWTDVAQEKLYIVCAPSENYRDYGVYGDRTKRHWKSRQWRDVTCRKCLRRKK